MAEVFLGQYPELAPFQLSKVGTTGTVIGVGTYGTVEEVTIPGAVCAAKKIHDHYVKASRNHPGTLRRVSDQFKRECLLMSTLRHPNIVQFLGLAFFPGSRLPALVMERLLTNLHDLLAPDADIQPPADPPKAFFPLRLKCSILQDVASGLAYLHNRSPPIIHRNLNAKKVLLNSGMVAKIADFGVARREAQLMTKGPGDILYMPPEAFAPAPAYGDLSQYNTSIDVFSLGVLAIFTITESYPSELLPATETDPISGLLTARPELERRGYYVKKVKDYLGGDHPFIKLIQQCLQNLPTRRPRIREVQQLLEEVITKEGGDNNEINIRDRVSKNADFKSRMQAKDRELAEAQQQLREKKEELRKAEETIRREQELVKAKDSELAETQKKLREKEEELRSSEALFADLKLQHTKASSTRAKGNSKQTLKKSGSTSKTSAQAQVPSSVELGTVIDEKQLWGVLNELCSVKEKWYDIGLGLGFDMEQLEELEKSNSKSIDCLRKMLQKWFQKGKQSWGAVVRVLKSAVVDEEMLADQLHVKYCSTSVDSSTTSSDAITPEDFGRFPAPNLCLLMEVVGVNVQAHWRDIGLGLGLKDQDLDLIQENNKHGVNPIQDCMRQVFVEWHSGATTTYSWKVLASILCSKMVNKPGLIPDIYSKLADEY